MPRKSNRKRALELSDQLTKLHELSRHRNASLLASVIALVPGDSVKDVAHAIGTTRQTVWNWQNGMAKPKRKHVERLAELTGLQVGQILGQSASAAAASAARAAGRR